MDGQTVIDYVAYGDALPFLGSGAAIKAVNNTHSIKRTNTLTPLNTNDNKDDFQSSLVSLDYLPQQTKHTVSFQSNGGTNVLDQQVVSGYPVNSPFIEKVGHTFKGWYLNSDLTGVEWDFTTIISSNIILYAKWEELVIPSDFVRFHETFETSTLTGSYSNKTFTGVNSIDWTVIHGRNEGTYNIDAEGILLRRADEPSSLEATFSNGISEFSFEYRKAYTDASARTYSVDITNNNETITHVIEEFGKGSGADATIHTFELKELSLEGQVTIKIYATGSNGNQQMVIDNFIWFQKSSNLIIFCKRRYNSIIKASRLTILMLFIKFGST